MITAVVTAFAAVLRLVELGRPARLVFDETYYVKQAYSLLTLGYEGRWGEDPNLDFAAGDYSDLGTDADYVVHPSVGKWMIALGMRFFATNDPVGWRISAAITGILSVLLLVRIGRRLFGSTALGAVAGLFLAVDGIHLVMSRISILDIFLSFWALCGFGAILLDREQYRRRLALVASRDLTRAGGDGRYSDPWGPRVGMRWWLVVAGICLGLASGVKWSGIYFVAVFGLLVVAWTISARRSIGVRFWIGGGAVRDGVSAFCALVPTAALTYVLTWLPWWLSPNSYLRHWARDVNAVAELPQRAWMPDWLNSWWEYHLRMWSFHNGLTSEHTYMSNPLGWLIQYRPTSFAWRDLGADQGAELICGSHRCASAILAVGNPVVWWGGVLALLVVIWAALRRRDWRAWAILAGYLAGYVPWLLYMKRTIFTFYTVAFVPYVALALTFALATLISSRRIPLRERRPGIWIAAFVVVAALAAGAFFWPIWTNEWIPYWYWNMHMFLPSWI
ncbi:phospholipid carrier-dependent glycosyltransferase [Pseudactinotalea sp. HY158]|nr:phospholipid carrier-dependent glycosyltransferase [Pseudactinotalea sp. HY158]